MKQYYSTRQVAELLKLKPDRLQKALWLGKFNAPAKSPSGGYLWTVEDIQRASWVLLHRAYESNEGGA